MQVRLQRIQINFNVYRLGVTHHMHIAVGKIDYPLTAWSNEIRPSDIPLLGHPPIKNFGTRWNLMDFQPRQILSKRFECVPDTVPGQAAREVPHLPSKFMHELTLEEPRTLSVHWFDHIHAPRLAPPWIPPSPLEFS